MTPGDRVVQAARLILADYDGPGDPDVGEETARDMLRAALAALDATPPAPPPLAAGAASDEQLTDAFFNREMTPNEVFHVKYGQLEALRRVEAAVRAAVLREAYAACEACGHIEDALDALRAMGASK